VVTIFKQIGRSGKMKIKLTLKNSFFALKAVFKYAPWVASVYALLSIVGAVFTTLEVPFLQRLIDGVKKFESDKEINEVILWGVLYVGSILLSQIYTFSLGKMGRFLNYHLTSPYLPQLLINLGA